MKYIGPFLRINTLEKPNIKNQMFHLAKEAVRHIVLESQCGIVMSPQELAKDSPNIDINTIKHFSPLLCIYKKASPKLTTEGKSLCWNKDKFKKEITIQANGFMVLSLLELADHYKRFKDIDKSKYKLSNTYLRLARKQLEFFASDLRNHEGVFVDKVDTSDPLLNDLKLEDKGSKFKFSNQALLMAAYYKYSTLVDEEEGSEFKKFSLDILNMFIEFKDEIYESSYNELLRVCIFMNLFYIYSKDSQVPPLLLDLNDLLMNNYKTAMATAKDDSIETDCMLYVNYMLMYKNTNILMFKEQAENIYDKLSKLYNSNLGIYTKSNDSKSIDYSCNEILLYLFTLIIQSDLVGYEKNDYMISDIFRQQIINSGLVLSWPDSPTLGDPEHYKSLSMHSEDLLDEQNFRMATIPTPQSSELAPIFIKRVSFNRKKEVFKQSKLSFDSSKNMLIYFMMIFYHTHG